jgi:hypothetical protein
MMNDRFSGPVFVVGIWRSGTSLLYTLLNQHPQIALTYESDLFLLRSLFRGGSNKSDWLERWEFWNSALTRHHIDGAKLAARFPDYCGAATAVCKQYAGAAIYGDKSPNYFDALPQLADDFPNARFIVIWRDLADTCSSIIRAAKGSSFFAKRGITDRALIGYRRLKRDCDTLTRRGALLHQIQYEEMIQSPESVMQGVCSFLQIPFDPVMTTLEGADRSAIYEAPQHAGVKSGRIRLERPREEVLPANLRAKIARYIILWNRESGGVWPIYPRLPEAATPPSLLERVRDEAYFRILRAFDHFTAWVYCYAPITWLRSYRASKAPAALPQSTKPAAEGRAVAGISTQG